MAKLIGPLMSMSAHGSIGRELTYSERKTVKQVRYQRKQKDIITDLRTAERNVFILGVAAWHTLTQDEQNMWEAWTI